jgi:DNA-binding PadR family transcriptional regulator
MLSDGPLHGYDLMQALEKRSGGRYVPSPGTIYPTLNKLEEFGLVSSERRMERRLFRLTPAGQAHLEASAEEVARFWLRWGKPNVSAEVDAEHQAIAQEWAALDELINQRLLAGLQRLSLEQVRQIRAALAGSRRTVEEVLGPRA